jgi:hypothetical protein
MKILEKYASGLYDKSFEYFDIAELIFDWL